MNPVDIIFSLLVLLAVARGYSRGLLGTVASYVAPVIAFLIAADWSDPVRDRLADSLELPDIALDLLAPLVVFVIVVVVIRLTAAVLARVLGLGLSMPGRVLAAAAGATMTALVLGSVVVVVNQASSAREDEVETAPETPEDALASPARNLLHNLDRRFDESLLAPPMAALAASVVREVMPPGSETLFDTDSVEQAAREATQNATDAAVDAVGKAAFGGSKNEGGRTHDGEGAGDDGAGRDGRRSGHGDPR